MHLPHLTHAKSAIFAAKTSIPTGHPVLKVSYEEPIFLGKGNAIVMNNVNHWLIHAACSNVGLAIKIEAVSSFMKLLISCS